MKLQFEPDLDFQRHAIDAVCDLFNGQEIDRNEFTVAAPVATPYLSGILESDLGVGNRLNLSDADILANLRRVQLRNGILPADALESGDFTVEMETGTGKTYVYLRTIFDLNRRYGFTKFVIIVPSIAIKEGVYHTLEITEDHFKARYGGIPYDYFLYDSTTLSDVRSFATSPTIQIMIATVGAINKKDVNNLYKNSEETGDERPIDLIRATRPIVIVDEPQSVDGGLTGAGRTALKEMHPLCTLRYSATHASMHHMVYRLTAVDAYMRKLVKQIEIASATVEDAHNAPFIQFISARSRRNVVTARILVDVQTEGGVRRKEVDVGDGDDLRVTTGREMYRDHRIGEVRAGRAGQMLELRVTGGEHYLNPGEAWGDVDLLAVQRQLIRRTIQEHLEKERRLRPLGIKVLSLFFIDVVDRYRQYDAEGNAIKGPYARMFEEEFDRLARHPDHSALFADHPRRAEEVHDGYFSIDKAGSWIDTAENNQINRESAERAYNLIMRKKEELLDLATPLAFIFSHSALREGWDNPNVFQICALREIRTERERRQTIGRGLRLCVDQSGNRVRGFEVNTLTVIATESYEEFADALQKEIESDTGYRFGVIEAQQFTGLSVTRVDGTTEAIDLDRSKEIWNHLRTFGFIDDTGRIYESLRTALRDGNLVLPDSVIAHTDQILLLLTRLAGRIEVKNRDERRVIRARPAVLQSPEFRALWDRIKPKTTYRIDFDDARLIDDCTRGLAHAPPIARARLQWRGADIAIGQHGVEAQNVAVDAPVAISESEVVLPDILTELQERTQLTRRSLCEMLTASGRLDDFRRNPQAFIDVAAKIIVHQTRLAMIRQISYQPIGPDHYYAPELFEQDDLIGYLRNMVAGSERKSVYEYVPHDSATEARFAEQLEHSPSVKVFVKLPRWFVIPTPLGPYNPDWAVVMDVDGKERLYLVVETKGSIAAEDLRAGEQGKIDCARAHFDALRVGERPARYQVTDSLDDVMSLALAPD